jgi:hypothetical protein
MWKDYAFFRLPCKLESVSIESIPVGVVVVVVVKKTCRHLKSRLA